LHAVQVLTWKPLQPLAKAIRQLSTRSGALLWQRYKAA